MTHIRSLPLVCLATLAPAAGVHAAVSAPVLAPITVQASDDNAADPSYQSALREVSRTPGSAAVIDPSRYDDGAILGLQDALSREPGIYVQSAAGQQSVKLSIRGSGLASPLGLRGVLLLRDGMPLSRADGISDPSYADPFNVDYIEVYRGANALQYGAATLGGAVNLVSPTGRSRPGLQLRMEAGSHGHIQAQARAGQVFDNGMDAYAAVSGYDSGGSVDHARQSVQRFYGNLGMRFSAASEGRLYLNIDGHKQDIVNPVTLGQLLGDSPADAPPPSWPERRISTQPHVSLAYRHTLRLGGEDSLVFGLHYTKTRFDISGGAVPIYYDASDYGLSARAEHHGKLAGLGNRLVWGANLSQGRSHNQSYGPFQLPGGHIYDPSTDQFENIRGRRQTAELYAEDSLALTPSLTLVAGAQAVLARREARDDVLRNPPGIPAFSDKDEAARYTGVNPKLGLLWQLAPQAQVFANVSRSYEPPSNTEFFNSAGTVMAQRAITYEVGTRGGSSRFNWEAAVYHSRVKDELLLIPQPGLLGRYEGGNIDRATHAGLELRLAGTLTPGGLPGALDWALAYTYNHFRFADDPKFGNNAVPGVPDHYGRLDLRYRHPSGVYLGPSLSFSSGWHADQANALRAPGYGIVDFTLGYAPPGARYQLYLDARNLADKRYAASTEYFAVADAGTQAFNPGLGRALYAGVQLQW